MDLDYSLHDGAFSQAGKCMFESAVSMSRLDFGYLSELPVLVLDVEDDFKNDRIRQDAIVDKVRFTL